jgi:hypothetical protein
MAGPVARLWTLDAEAATIVTFDPRRRVPAATQGLFVAPIEAVQS